MKEDVNGASSTNKKSLPLPLVVLTAQSIIDEQKRDETSC